MQDWNDLRFFIEIARHGSTLAASVRSKTSQSTVFRRITALEQSLGLALFDRRPTGYQLTAAGAELLPFAQQVEAAVALFAQAAAREERKQTTVIRFSAPDITIEYLLPTLMGTFRQAYPGVQIELVASDRQLDLATGEADVALRINPAVNDGELFGRRIAYEQPMLITSKTYAARHPLPTSQAELAEHAFISLTSNLSTLLGSWFDRTVPKSRVLLQPDTLASTLAAVRGGLGITVMPQFICDRDSNLIPVPVPLPVPNFEMWIVSHDRLRNVPAVRALMEMVASYVIETSVDRSAK